MEFEKDYVLRMAKELGDAIARLVFGRSLESVEEQEPGGAEVSLSRLLERAAGGDVGGAEDELFGQLRPGDSAGLQMALRFYLHLNEYPDSFLEAHDFAREEIWQGMRDAARRYGLTGLEEVL